MSPSLSALAAAVIAIAAYALRSGGGSMQCAEPAKTSDLCRHNAAYICPIVLSPVLYFDCFRFERSLPSVGASFVNGGAV
ncbi:MAG: hypothetical protein JZD41_00015, partial [Thermoproteus sp.]|nr:hypothetical protein [Thermoproteus sp.]